MAALGLTPSAAAPVKMESSVMMLGKFDYGWQVNDEGWRWSRCQVGGPEGIAVLLK